jgi:2,3-bisphosphoglycerate-dependent phosphoglycerate mutase
MSIDVPDTSHSSDLSARILFMKALAVVFWFFILVSLACAEPVVVIVRHAEKADNGEDAELSDAGRRRAETLSHILKDANIVAIFTSERKRTQETAAPLAKLVKVNPTIVPAKDYAALVSKLRDVKGNALVVGHGNTIPDLIKALGIDTSVRISENDYSDIFVVALGAQSHVMRLHYP